MIITKLGLTLGPSCATIPRVKASSGCPGVWRSLEIANLKVKWSLLLHFRHSYHFMNTIITKTQGAYCSNLNGPHLLCRCLPYFEVFVLFLFHTLMFISSHIHIGTHVISRSGHKQRADLPSLQPGRPPGLAGGITPCISRFSK